MQTQNMKHRVKLHKVKKQWVAIGLTTAAIAGAAFASTDSVSADTWTPNSVESIASRIKESDTSITMQKGDTVYNIAQALNIKNPMSLLSDNGYVDGDQYDLSVGTVISWNGNKVTVTDTNGNVLGQGTITPDEKVDASKPVANQKSDEVIESQSTTSVSTSTISVSTSNAQSSDQKETVVSKDQNVENPSTSVSNETLIIDNSSNQEVTSAREALNLAIANENAVKAELERLNNELVEATRQYFSYDSLLKNLYYAEGIAESAVSDKNAEISEVQAQLDASTDEVEKAQLSEKISSLKFELLELQAKHDEAKATLEKETAQYRPLMNDLQVKRAELEATISSVTTKLSEATALREAALADADNKASQPVAETPVTEEPVTETPVVEEPVVKEPVTEEPVTETPVVEEPVTEEPVTETPVTEEPVTETPVVEEPVTEEPVTETPVVEEPVTETPVVEEPVTETPVVEEPVIEEPVTETPNTNDTMFDEATAVKLLEMSAPAKMSEWLVNYRKSLGIEKEIVYSNDLQNFVDARADQITREYDHTYQGRNIREMASTYVSNEDLATSIIVTNARENIVVVGLRDNSIDVDKVVEKMMNMWKESSGHDFNMRADDYKYYAFSVKYANGAYYGVFMATDNIFE